MLLISIVILFAYRLLLRGGLRSRGWVLRGGDKSIGVVVSSSKKSESSSSMMGSSVVGTLRSGKTTLETDGLAGEDSLAARMKVMTSSAESKSIFQSILFACSK